MATLMDVSLFSYFGSIFLFLMVFVIVYGLLSMSKMFGTLKGANGIYAIISLGIAFFVLMFEPVSAMISVMIPWFTVVIILMFLIMFVVKMFDSDTSLFSGILKSKGVHWTLITVFIIIILASLSSTFGQSLLTQNENVVVTTEGEIIEATPSSGVDIPVNNMEPGSTGTDDFGNNMLMTLVNPKVLGLILMMIIGLFTIMLMADSQVMT